MPQTATTESRIAYCRERDANDFAQVVHGVAHGADEFTRGLNGPKFWPAAELKQAAPTLKGRTVYKVHGDGEREVVGEVLRAAYQANLGVVYEAGIDDPDVAEELASGQREVSIEAGNPSSVDQHDETGAVIMRDYEYTGLATPKSGASEANYTAPGPADQNPAVAALSAHDLEAALAAADDGGSVDAEIDDEVPETCRECDDRARTFNTMRCPACHPEMDPDGDHPPLVTADADEIDAFQASLATLGSLSAGDIVSWRTGNGTLAYGKVRAKIRRGKFDTLLSTSQSVTAPAALIGVFEPGQGNEWTSSDRMVARKPGSVTTHDNFPAAPATEAALATDGSTPGADGSSAADDPPPTDDPQGEVLDGSDTDTEPDTDTPMSDDNDDKDVEAFLERLDEKDEQINDLEADLEETEAELSEKEARVEELEDETDDRIAELEEEVEELREQNEAAREQYAAALAEADTVFDEDELAENYTLAELSAKIEEADFSTDDGGAEPFIRSGSGEGVEANLSAAEQEEKAELEAKLDDLDEKEGPLVEKERERVEAELAELTGGEA